MPRIRSLTARNLDFWTFVVAMPSFAGGGIVSLYQGVSRFVHSRPLDRLGWTYAIPRRGLFIRGRAQGISIQGGER